MPCATLDSPFLSPSNTTLPQVMVVSLPIDVDRPMSIGTSGEMVVMVVPWQHQNTMIAPNSVSAANISNILVAAIILR